MKTVIVCHSESHGNTRRVAEAIGGPLEAEVVALDDVDAAELPASDLVGFGSGIFLRAFHPRLRRFVDALADGGGRRAFVFATSGLPEGGYQRFGRPLVRQLESRNFDVVDTFSCRGFDTWFPFKIVGGIRKGRPDACDLDAAREFGRRLRDRRG
ncbi:MAG TPA: flavodoxin family protein [Stackebrandtia sp.]|jgi:flavodoxin|uniref:flavodoxin family protein n=1 Tax=Stackebrandtia sp. TaxID=2023065 RepID=UPI002D3E1C70|nr:flavodoxin family protein [Stackebrandtia sp.]HZE41715.1 flavodoxin family protein [Stackebrandtia sp.]